MVKVLNNLAYFKLSNSLKLPIKLTWRYKFLSCGNVWISLWMLVNPLWERSIHMSCYHFFWGKTDWIISEKPYKLTILLYLKNREVVLIYTFLTCLDATFSVLLLTNYFIKSPFTSSISIVLTMFSFNFASPTLSEIYFSDEWLILVVVFSTYSLIIGLLLWSFSDKISK